MPHLRPLYSFTTQFNPFRGVSLLLHDKNFPFLSIAQNSPKLWIHLDVFQASHNKHIYHLAPLFPCVSISKMLPPIQLLKTEMRESPRCSLSFSPISRSCWLFLLIALEHIFYTLPSILPVPFSPHPPPNSVPCTQGQEEFF